MQLQLHIIFLFVFHIENMVPIPRQEKRWRLVGPPAASAPSFVYIFFIILTSLTVRKGQKWGITTSVKILYNLYKALVVGRGPEDFGGLWAQQSIFPGKFNFLSKIFICRENFFCRVRLWSPRACLVFYSYSYFQHGKWEKKIDVN